jgi:RimJ/RimL family protein N-acetyltransferase
MLLHGGTGEPARALLLGTVLRLAQYSGGGSKRHGAARRFWIYHCRTHESAQGLGIYPFVLSAIQRDYFTRGSREGIIYTTIQNIASQRGIVKAGFRLERELRALRIGRHYFKLSAERAL